MNESDWPAEYRAYVEDVKSRHVVHLPGHKFTACGICYWTAAPGTPHTQECLQGGELCSGQHVTTVGSSNNPDLVNCPECLAAMARPEPLVRASWTDDGT